MPRILKIVIVAAVLALILNDGGRWGQAVVDLRTSTGQVLDQAALSAKHTSQPQLADLLAQQGAAQGIRVTQYALTPTGVRVWTEESVTGTWVVGPYVALTHGVTFSKAFGTPFTVTYDAEEAIR